MTMSEAWAALTAPLEHYQPPVIITDAERAASDAIHDQLRVQAHEDQARVDAWFEEAREATFGPLDDWLHREPEMMP